MTEGTVAHLMVQMLTVALELSIPVIGAAFVAGFLLSLLQATTQMNDPALSFVPKLVAVAAALLFLGGAMLSLLTDYTRTLWLSLPQLLR